MIQKYGVAVFVAPLLVLTLVAPSMFPVNAFAVSEEESVCTSGVVTISSNETATVGVEESATAAWMPETWAMIPGATWIWNAFYAQHPSVDETVVVTQRFSIAGTPTGGVLTFLADDFYDVSINGTTIDSDHSSVNYTATKTIVVPAAVLVTGTNTIQVTVVNRGDPIAVYGDENPAGTAYELVVTTRTCPEVPPETPVAPPSNPGTAYVYGCTNPLADNYNPSATSDDNTCHAVVATSTTSATSTNEGVGSTTPATGEVLGATATSSANEVSACGAYLTDYLKMGKKNNPEQVTKLQEFLNLHMSAGLPVTGFFGIQTKKAVAAFQVKYHSEILAPWKNIGAGKDIENGTGYVYKTTKHQINALNCATLNEVAPQLP